MMRTTIARYGMLLVLGMLIAASSVAHAAEHRAMLAAQGTTTAMVHGQRVAAAPQGARVVLTGSDFAPDEPIALWQTLPDGAVIGLDPGTIHSDNLGQFTATILLRPALATGLHHLTARGRRSGHEATAAVLVLPGEGPAPTAGARILLAPATARQLETITLSGSGFQGGETVAFWLTLPDGSVMALDRIVAEPDGTVRRLIALPGFLQVGRYALSGHGTTSGATAIGTFVLEYGNGLDVPGARLAANLGATIQGTVLEIEAAGFAAGEEIALWQTLPNGAVVDLGPRRAGGDGTLHLSLVLSERLPIGTHYFSIRGNSSNQGSFARLVLRSGGEMPTAN